MLIDSEYYRLAKVCELLLSVKLKMLLVPNISLFENIKFPPHGQKDNLNHFHVQ